MSDTETKTPAPPAILEPLTIETIMATTEEPLTIETIVADAQDASKMFLHDYIRMAMDERDRRAALGGHLHLEGNGGQCRYISDVSQCKACQMKFIPGITVEASPCFQLCAERPDLYADSKLPGGERGDSGIDIRFPADVLVPPTSAVDGRPTIIDLGVRARCVDRGGYEPYKLLPRSSIGKTPLECLGPEIEGTPLKLANVAGIIDRGYQGPLKAAVRNHSATPWQIRAGDAYFQLVRDDLRPACTKLVDAADPAFAVVTVRGDGGFGSSGAQGSGAAQTTDAMTVATGAPAK